MSLIDRYILRAVLTPLILALCVAAMLLLLEQMLRLFDFVLAEQGPVEVVGRMMANLVPHYLGLALPLGTFLGIMMAFRSLSLSSELDALNSSGTSSARLLRPVYMLIILLMVGDFLLVSYVQPFGRYTYKQIRYDVTSGAFGIRIQAGDFIELDDGVVIRLGAIDRVAREARDVFIERTNDQGRRNTITAQRGAISTSTDLSVLNMQLFDGNNLIVSAKGDEIQSLDFETFNLTLDLPSATRFRARGADARDAREATIREMWSVLRRGRETQPVRYDAYRAGFHWRLLQPLSFLILPILGAAMGITGRRRASNIKPIIGIGILIAYHELVQEWGQVMVSENGASPYLTIWGLFALFAVISFVLYNNAIDQARNARLMSRIQNKPVRVAAPPTEGHKKAAKLNDISSTKLSVAKPSATKLSGSQDLASAPLTGAPVKESDT